MERKWIIAGLLLLITGIALGAFGAHALKDLIADPGKLVIFETGVRYQLLHAIGFLIVPFVARHYAVNTKWIFRFLLAGVLCFSVSLYMLSLKGLLEIPEFRFFGPVTPLGGLLMILGWTALLVHVMRKR